MSWGQGRCPSCSACTAGHSAPHAGRAVPRKTARWVCCSTTVVNAPPADITCGMGPTLLIQPLSRALICLGNATQGRALSAPPSGHQMRLSRPLSSCCSQPSMAPSALYRMASRQLLPALLYVTSSISGRNVSQRMPWPAANAASSVRATPSSSRDACSGPK